MKPWENEPNFFEWEHVGLRCVIRRARLGHLCGYVGIPRGHPLWGLNYWDSAVCLRPMLEAMLEKPVPNRLAVFIGLLSGKLEPTLDVVFDVHGGLTYSGGRLPGKKGPDPDGLWWFGFDCYHLGDLAPASLDRDLSEGEYRDFNYVKRETEKLAEQLAAIAQGGESEAGTRGS